MTVKFLSHPKESGMFLLAILETRAIILMVSPLKPPLPSVASPPLCILTILSVGICRGFPWGWTISVVEGINRSGPLDVFWLRTQPVLEPRYGRVQTGCCHGLHESFRAIPRRKLEPLVQSLALQYYSPVANAAEQAEERQAYFGLEYLFQRLANLHDLAFKGTRHDLVLSFAFNT